MTPVLGEAGGALTRVLPEETLADAVDLLVRLVEGAAAVVVFAGAGLCVRAAGRGRSARRSDETTFVPIRYDLGRYLLLGLEFQLAADVLKTAVRAHAGGDRPARGDRGDPPRR